MEENKHSSEPLLEIFLLGRFRAKIAGVPIDEKRWSRRAAKSLVKLLALKPHHALHREQIMDLLWTEESQETALNNLNKAIHAARRAFEPNLAKGSRSQFILTPKDQIVLSSPNSLRIDSDEFEKLANYAIRNEDLETGEKAVALYSGDLLVEDIYEDWIYARREAMRILFRKTATKTAELYAAQGEHRAGIEILQKLLAEDSSDEHIHRLLMRFHAVTGSKYQALKQFEQCRAALRALGIEPEPETFKLEGKIKRGEILPIQNGNNRASAPKAALMIVSTPRITPLTFQNGSIKSAKYCSDGKTIMFTADWNGSASELFTLCSASGEISSLGVENAEVLSISSAGNLAVLLNPKPFGFYKIGTLAKLLATGETPRELLPSVHWADWHPLKSSDSSLPDTESLAIVRDENGKNRLEFPFGSVICETAGWIGHPRFSPDGKKIAFIEHPFFGDDRGRVAICDLENKETRILPELYVSIQGLAWSNNEIWFTAARQGNARSIEAVNSNGETRTIYRATGSLTLHDVAINGRALVTDNKTRVQTAARRAVDEAERDLSWHDWTLPRDLTADGETLLFEEGGASGGSQFAAYIRKIDGSAIKKIGDGSALALSPDGKYALLRSHNPNQLALVPTGAGEIIRLETDPANPLDYEVSASFFPNGKRIIFAAIDVDGNKRIYVQSIAGGKPVRFKPDEIGLKMLSAHPFSPDGERLILTDSENRLALYQICGGASSPLKNLEKDFWLIGWTDDGENIFVWQRGELPATVYKYNLASGKKQEWLRLMPKNASGVCQFGAIKITPDGKTYAYSYMRESSDLFLMEDLR